MPEGVKHTRLFQIRRLADAFADTWSRFSTWGNYLLTESGDVAVYRTTGAAIVPAALTLAARYFGDDRYLDIARKGADALYDEFAVVGFTSGGCGDILQNADSETAIALTTSMMTLYEATGEDGYLYKAMRLADLTSSWTVSFDYRLPADLPLARLGANLTGAVWASTQNKHGAPGFCTQSGDALFKIYRATGETRYAELLRDIIHGYAEGIQPNGKITERLTYCDADHRGSRADGWQTGWNETCGALMGIEVPGIYVRTDSASIYVFDHIEASVRHADARRLQLSIHNPTPYDAVVTIMADDAYSAAVPLGDNAVTTSCTGHPSHFSRVRVKSGATVTHTIPRQHTHFITNL